MKTLRDVFHETPAVREKAFANLGLPSGTTSLEAVEEAVEIDGWLTKALKKRVRFPDITLKINGLKYRLDIKNWGFFPPNDRQLKGAIDAMRRDLVIHLKEGSLDRLRWVFPEALKGKRAEIIQELKKATYGREFRRRLRQTDFANRYPATPEGERALEAAVQSARRALDSGVVCFHDLSLVAGP